MATYADTFFQPNETFQLVYYPDRKVLHVEFQRDMRDEKNIDNSKIVEALKFVKTYKDDLSKATMLKTNKLIQEMPVEKLVFESIHFGTEKKNAKDFHDKILDGDSKKVVDLINTVYETENPFYYASGMGIFWQLDLKEPFTIFRKKEKKIVLQEDEKLFKHLSKLEKDKKIYYIRTGLVDKRTITSKGYHAFDTVLLNKFQRRAYIFSVRNSDHFKLDKWKHTKRDFHADGNDFFTGDSFLKNMAVVFKRTNDIAKGLKKFNVKFAMAKNHGHVTFLVYLP